MNEYLYKAKNFDGDIIKGKYSAVTLNGLIDYLHEKGYYLIDYRCKGKNVDFLAGGRIGKRELSIFCKQLSVILQSGIPMIESLTLLAFQSTTTALREAISLLISNIKNGESLHSGLQSSKYKFPDFMINMLRIGEESGTLDEVLIQLSNYYEKENKISKRVIGAMLYPAAVFIVAMMTVTVLMITVVPSITGILTSMGGEIPPITLFVILISSLLKRYGIYLLAGIVTFNILGIFFVKKCKFDIHKQLLIKVPGIRKLYRNILEIKFSRAMSIMLESGMSLISSLEFTSNLINISKLRYSMNEAIEQINSGCNLCDALISMKVFDPLALSMIKVGEETGRLDEMLSKLTEVLEEETYDLLGRLTDFIQPVMIVALSIIVGLIVASVMLPLFSVMDTIK